MRLGSSLLLLVSSAACAAPLVQDAGASGPAVLESLRDARAVEVRALGWSSLVLDYRGLGRSDGRRDAGRLRADGRAMWREAVRRAGGAPGRVVVRAASLGSLVAADLLARGGDGIDESSDGRPAGAVLVAPVRASTVGRHAWCRSGPP